jgi:HEAT repeat protein
MGLPAQEALTALITALKDKASVQSAAAASIDSLATPDPDPIVFPGIIADAAGEPMMALMKDASAPVPARCSAARLISKLKSVDGRITALTDVLADEKNDAQLRKTAVEMLGRFKELAADAVPALAKALSDKNVDLRIAAGGALARIGPQAKGALPEIRKALKDGDANVRNRAIDVLAKLASDAADGVSDLMECLRTEKVLENRVAAIKALGLIGPAAKDAVGLLTDYTTSANAEVRKAANEALKKIGT